MVYILVYRMSEQTKHWWQQRVTAALLALMVVWFFIIRSKTSSGSVISFFDYVKNPIHVVFMVAIFLVGIYHGYLGIKEVITDYIKNFKLKVLVVAALDSVVFFTVVGFCVANFYLILKV